MDGRSHCLHVVCTLGRSRTTHRDLGRNEMWSISVEGLTMPASMLSSKRNSGTTRPSNVKRAYGSWRTFLPVQDTEAPSYPQAGGRRVVVGSRGSKCEQARAGMER